MKEFFYLKGGEQHGPFSIEEMKNQRLVPETLIWTEGMNDWKPMQEVYTLFPELKPKAVPPPPPQELKHQIDQTQKQKNLLIKDQKAE